MTEITNAEAAEVLWASSEQGEAAVKAAYEYLRNLDEEDGGGRRVGMADVGAAVYAAYLAAGWDAEPTEDAAHGCQHSWTILGAQEVPPVMAFMTKPVLRTAVLARCAECGEPTSWLLNGTWTLEALRETEVLHGLSTTGT